MLKKIEKSRIFLEENIVSLRCPICHDAFSLSGNSLICEKKHTYNLNKKGSINFLKKTADTEHYTRKMFEPRRRLIQAGMYGGLLAAIQPNLTGSSLLDVGTGEGSFLQLLPFNGSKFAFDIANDGIEMATDLDVSAFLALADLTNLPFADQSMSTILNILTPSNYAEFKRVLMPNGRLIKVLPDKFYLRELREAYEMPVEHDNSAVIANFAKEFPDFKQTELFYKFTLPEDLRLDFLAMSPLEWSASEEVKSKAVLNSPKKATIHMQLLISN
ncbi:MAG: methyltransferase domain-containing protein [Streptococcaceae bacterium]|jgi:23S rRNA (guanine745-N1)-methyltransferase|nr:methyltransferase domain-containing protein [Streptococcaceae bacterium]